MRIGINSAPGWLDTIDGRYPDRFRRSLLVLNPHTLRMPWANNSGCTDAMRLCAEHGIDVLLIVGQPEPEKAVAQIEATGLPVAAVEGLNEPDLPATGYTNTPVPISGEKLARVQDHQERLYAAVNGRWPVLSPSALYVTNWDALYKLPCDIISAHLYPSDLYGLPPQPSGARLPAYGKPVWVTETGQFNYRKWIIPPFTWKWQVTQAMQRDFILAQVKMLSANGARRVFVYTLTDAESAPWAAFLHSFDPAHNWGLFRYDGKKKLAVDALRGPMLAAQ